MRRPLAQLIHYQRNAVVPPLLSQPARFSLFLSCRRRDQEPKTEKGEAVGETSNTAIIANKISKDIFKVFHWEMHQQHDANFDCVLADHKTPSGNQKKQHPGDVVFHYIDPYLNKRIHLHTDLKSYSKNSLQQKKIREALQSLAMTIECAAVSKDWRQTFCGVDQEPSEVRGLLFVANHDNKAPDAFDEQILKISAKNLPVAKGQQIHVLGPKSISQLFSVATDIKLAIQDKELSPRYRFLYPDLTLWKRQRPDDERIGATIETLMSPYFIIKHDEVRDEQDKSSVILRSGSLVYYSRAGDTVEEFVYLLDSLLRYQLVNAKEIVRIRVFNPNRSGALKNNFEKAKERYCRTWGFEHGREQEIRGITIDSIAKIEHNYCPQEIGWSEE